MPVMRRRTGRPSRAARLAAQQVEADLEAGGVPDTSWKEPPPVAGEAALVVGDGDEAHEINVDDVPPTRREINEERAQRVAQARRPVPPRNRPIQATVELPEAPELEDEYPTAPEGHTPSWLENNNAPAARKALKQNTPGVPAWANAYKSGPPRVRVKPTPGEAIASKRAHLIAQLREELAALEGT